MMKPAKYILLFALCCFPLFAWGAERERVDLIDAVTANRTSSTYLISTASPGETIYFQISTPDTGTGTITIQGSLSTETEIRDGTAVWSDLYSTTTIAGMTFVEDPPFYVRVVAVRSGGTLNVTMGGRRMTFTKVR